MNLLIFRETTETFQKKKAAGIMNIVSFFAFCLIIIDCAVSGGGHWLMMGPLSLRMVLLLVAFIFAVPCMIKSFSKWVREPMLISFGLFAVYLIVSIFLGIANANRADVLLSDIKGFVWLAMIPVALAVLNSRERIIFLLKCMAAAAILQALYIIALNITCSLYDNWFNVFYEPIIKLQLGFVDSVSERMFRIFFKSGPYLAVGIIIILYLQSQKKKFSWFYSVSIGLCFSAILLSFTRSLYGATVIAIVLFFALGLFLTRRYWKRILLTIGLACVTMVAVIMVMQVLFGANYFRFAISRTLSIDIVEQDLQNKETLSNEDLMQQAYIERTKDSDQNTRETTLKELKKMISKSPIIGNGLGASISYRDDGLVEYFYYDILNKMGIVGLLLYYFPIGYMVYFLLKKRKLTDDLDLAFRCLVCLSGLAVFIFITYFNPYMNSSIGISGYSISIGCFMVLQKKIKLSKTMAAHNNSGSPSAQKGKS